MIKQNSVSLLVIISLLGVLLQAAIGAAVSGYTAAWAYIFF
jgi:hypothetical protein